MAMKHNPVTTTDTPKEPRTLHDILPRYAVVLHNDHHHAMDYVVAALCKSVPSLSAEEAVNIMFEAHNTGRAVVIMCPLEHAELYQLRICGCGLGVTIEKA